MHKGIILLIKANDRVLAKEKADEFMEGYGDGKVWDWYVIGGRWSRMLNPLTTPFFKKAKTMMNKGRKEKAIYMSTVESNKHKLQELWEKIGGKRTNPYSSDQYDQEGELDDIMPLKDCVDMVKNYGFDSLKQANKELRDAKKRYCQKDKEVYSMYGYCLKIAGNIFAQDFCFECNVYNTEDWNYSIPEDTKGYYAVVVDIHN